MSVRQWSLIPGLAGGIQAVGGALVEAVEQVAVAGDGDADAGMAHPCMDRPGLAVEACRERVGTHRYADRRRALGPS
jgi:hypothetical protein